MVLIHLLIATMLTSKANLKPPLPRTAIKGTERMKTYTVIYRDQIVLKTTDLDYARNMFFSLNRHNFFTDGWIV